MEAPLSTKRSVVLIVDDNDGKPAPYGNGFYFNVDVQLRVHRYEKIFTWSSLKSVRVGIPYELNFMYCADDILALNFRCQGTQPLKPSTKIFVHS